MNEHETPTDPRGYEPPSDPQIDAAKLFATAAGEVIAEKLKPLHKAVAAVADLVTRDHVSTSRRLAILEATRLAPAAVAVALSVAAFGLAVLASSRPAEAAGPRCPDRVEVAP